MLPQPARWLVALPVLLLVGAAGPAARARDGAAGRLDRLEAVKAEYDRQLTAYRAAVAAAKTDPDREAAEKSRPSLNAFGKRLLALAEERPADAVARDALLWVAANYGRREKLDLDRALDLIEQHHLAAPQLKTVVDALAYADSRRANALAETLAEKAGDREVRGLACFFVGYAAYARTGARDADSQARVERWMERVRKDYADIRFEKRTLGDLAEGQLFEMRHLVPGKAAPALAGASVSGQTLNLGDHRGKVVMLVFWGSWCGPCMAEVPHLRDLTARYAGRPFTVFGVNCGDTRRAAARAVRDQRMAWPVVFDGEDGPVARGWNALSFPTVYVIDAAGVIRYKDGGGFDTGEEFDAAVEALVREAERRP